jgi:hypothetical protein
MTEIFSLRHIDPAARPYAVAVIVHAVVTYSIRQSSMDQWVVARLYAGQGQEAPTRQHA